MAITSFPWASVGGDRPVSDTMDAAYFAAAHGNIVLHGLQPTVSGTNVSVSAGMAVVQGRVVNVGAAVTLTPTVNRRARIVLRLDLTNRTAAVVLSGTTTSYPSLTRTGSVWEMGLGTADTTAALVVTDTRHDLSLCGIVDTGWMTGQLTATSGWSISSQQIRRIGKVVQLRLVVNRTGSAISVPSDGNIPNTTVATLPAWAVPSVNSALTSADTGRLASATVSPVEGGVSLAAVAPGANLAQGESVSFGGTYFID